MSDYTPFISVIMLDFNGPSYTIDCIESVLASNYPKFEIIVIDNASTGDDYQIFKKKYKNNKKVRVFRSDKQLYFCGGHNWGAKLAKGEKLILLNNDTTVDKNWLTPLVKMAKNNKKWLIQPKILSFNNKKIIDSVGSKYNILGMGIGGGYQQIDNGQYDQNYQVDFVAGACFFINRDFFLKLGGFDPWFKFHYEDTDISFRAKAKGGQCWYCHNSVVYHKGSLTLNTQAAKEITLIHVRKNRPMVIIKNFRGLKRVFRLMILGISYIFFIIQDLFKKDAKKRLVTIKAIVKIIKHI